MSVIENHISGNFNKFFSQSSDRKMYGLSKDGLVPFADKDAIKNCSTVFQAFSSRSLSLCNLYFLFHNGKDISAIPPLTTST